MEIIYILCSMLSANDWEFIGSGQFNTFRLRVFGGWIVRVVNTSGESMVTMTFVPDPNHDWIV